MLLRLKKRGSAIALAMVGVLILFAMGTELLSLDLNSHIISKRITSDLAARCADDAGLFRTISTQAGVAEQLPADSAGMNAQFGGNSYFVLFLLVSSHKSRYDLLRRVVYNLS